MYPILFTNKNQHNLKSFYHSRSFLRSRLIILNLSLAWPIPKLKSEHLFIQFYGTKSVFNLRNRHSHCQCRSKHNVSNFLTYTIFLPVVVCTFFVFKSVKGEGWKKIAHLYYGIFSRSVDYIMKRSFAAHIINAYEFQ